MSRTLDRIAKVLNQAENAATPEEAEAYFEKFQFLATQAGIDLAVARAHTVGKEKRESVEVDRSIQVNPYDRKMNKDHFMDLYLAMAEANDVMCTIGGSRTFVFATGFPSDIDVTEALFGVLAMRMAQDCAAKLKAGANYEQRVEAKRVKVRIPEEERDWDGWDSTRDRWYDGQGGRGSNPPPKMRYEYVYDKDGNRVYAKKWFAKVPAGVYRANFYAGFIHSTRVRLMKARQEAQIKAGEDSPSSGVDLVLADKKKEVHDTFEEQVMGRLRSLNPRGVGSYGGAKQTAYDDEGRSAGAASANAVKYGDEGNDLPGTDRVALA